jgi:Rv2525c-like, glycoside hydrolase-like domain
MPAAFVVVAALACIGGGVTGAAAATPRTRSATGAGDQTKVVRYHGYRLVVPASWPVYDLASAPATCVRFNRHAVYLGTPSSRQRCPAHAVGRTEAILVSPLSAHGARAGASSGQVLPPVTNAKAQAPRGSSTQLAFPSAGVLVSATWSSDPTLVARALGVHSVSGNPAGAAAAVRPEAHPAAIHRAGDPLYTGPGFDACSTPSLSTMSAWGASPYRAIGFYIGGANEACSQPNLNASWVEQESAAGWALLPIYVGLQAPSNGCGCAGITASEASAQGTAAADDAINQAEAVGLGPGNPIYDDMEAYSRTSTNTAAVLAFLGAWTTELHAHGYASGIYSSATSGVTDLVNQVGTGYPEPDEIWNAEWNNQASTTSAYIPSGDWANHQRLHQYQGGHNATYGAVTINIDSDYVDAGGAGGGALFPDGTFVQESGSPYIFEIAGGAPLLVDNWSDVGGAQNYTVITPQQFASLNPVPANGTFLEAQSGAVYRVAGGAPMYVSAATVFPGITPVLIDGWDIDNLGNPLSHLNAVPVNGTFLTTTTGLNYRVAGGAPIGVTNWKVFGGTQPSVTVDSWDLANVFNPLARLVYRPAVGTTVEGLPSGAYWRFGPKNRYLVTTTAGAVRVDDRGLAPFSAIPCRVPNLAHETLTQVKAALLKADCHLGKVHDRPVTRRRHTLRVIRQIPAARTSKRAYYTVGVTLG